ncbi:hypothetical protein ACHAXS_008934 [Conticribra weissflogii]
MTILHSGYSDAIQWLPHGRSWRIKDKAKLVNEVLPRYFQIANFNSFVRLVNAWGFRRIKFGNDTDSYYHEVRDGDDGCVTIEVRKCCRVSLELKTQTVSFFHCNE